MSDKATTTAKAIAFTMGETETLRVLRARGADEKAQAVFDLLAPYFSQWYIQGSHAEQFGNKATATRPIRPLFAWIHADRGRAARQARAMIQTAAPLIVKGRDRSEDGHVEFMGTLHAAAMAGLPAPAKEKTAEEKAAAEEKKAAAARAKAVEAVKAAASTLTEEEAAALRAALATYEAIKAADKAPAKATARAAEETATA